MRRFQSDEEALALIDSGAILNEDELQELAYYMGIDDEYGENRRWSRWRKTIVDLCGRYFAIEWDEGLTEMQPDEFYEQPYEVNLNEYDKVIHVKEWVKKE